MMEFSKDQIKFGYKGGSGTGDAGLSRTTYDSATFDTPTISLRLVGIWSSSFIILRVLLSFPFGIFKNYE